MDAGDVAFEGQGPGGHSVCVGIERKTIGDLIDSLNTGRLTGMESESSKGGQIGRLVQSFDHVWLLVEGDWKADAHGRLVTHRKGGWRPLPGSMTQDSLDKRLLTIELLAGIRVVRTRSMKESARWIASLFRWWTEKAWDEHRTLATVYRPKSLRPISRFRESLMVMLPGVGFAASKALEHACEGSLETLFRMSEADIAETRIATPAGPRRIGPAKARRFVTMLQEIR